MAVPARPTSGVPIETAWGQVAHDTAVAQDVQAGTVVASVTAGVAFDQAITFPRAFASVPAVVCGVVGGNTNLANLVSIPTATGASVRLFRRDGGTLVAGAMTVYWVAIGPRA
jgi:hypothetical protein